MSALRQSMVAEQLRSTGIRDEAVLAAMAAVPREEFVRARCASMPMKTVRCDRQGADDFAAVYGRLHVPGGTDPRYRQSPGNRHGLGLRAAVLSRIAKQVFTVERIGDLAQQAQSRLKQLGYSNVQVFRPTARSA